MTEIDPPKPVERPPYIVGIGASAGGLEALETFFDHLHQATGAAFVVIQHLSPDFESLMDQLLARHTRMPVHVVTEGVEIRPNTVYLIPPKKEMIVSNGLLHLTDRDPVNSPVLPIDTFFRSLASEMGPKSIAIVLSGTGGDGSKGLVDVANAGGLVVAQTPESAKFDGMPRSAIATGRVAKELRPESMSAVLESHMSASQAPATLPTPPINPDTGPFSQIIAVLHNAGGVDFSSYKTSTVTRRIERRMMLMHISSAEEYLELLIDDPVERDALFFDLLIGVTHFMRDRESFEALVETVFPDLIENASEKTPVRVWVPACATGEEPYTLAILLHEAFRQAKKPAALKIFATDVHRKSLEFAGAGSYQEGALSELDPKLRDRYFRRDAGRYIVNDLIRSSVIFAKQDVLKDPPFTKVDLVSCRNMLIYFIPSAQEKAISLFHFALNTGGVLFLGSSETLGNLENEFATLNSAAKIYRKRRATRLPTTAQFALPLATGRREPPFLETALARPPSRYQESNLLHAYDSLLESVVPSGVLCDRDRHILHVFGDAGNYLITPRGRDTGDINIRVSGDMKVALASAIHAAQKHRRATSYHSVVTDVAGQERKVDVTVRLIPSRKQDDEFLLIDFRDSDVDHSPEEATAIDETAPQTDEQSRSLIDDLQRELQYSRENLQTTIEELETSNEELQATNEELMSSNEELQSTNEELHSVNEELYSVNSEHQRKISELTQVTAELDHLLSSTNIATIFLNDDFSIRKFTNTATNYFNLLPQDVGRPIQHVTPKFNAEVFIDKLVEAVTKNGATQCEFTHDGQHALARMQAFDLGQSNTRGLVITIVDVTHVKNKESELRSRQRLFDAIAESSRDAFVVADANTQTLEYVSKAGDELFGVAVSDWEGKSLRQWVETAHSEDQQRVIDALEQCWDVTTSATYRVQGKDDASPRWIFTRFSPVYDESGQAERVVAISSDLTELEQAREAMRVAKGWLAEMVSGLPFPAVYVEDEHCEPNAEAMELLGRPGRSVSSLIEFLRMISPSDGNEYLSLLRQDREHNYREPRTLDFHLPGGVVRKVRIAGYRGEKNDVLLLTDITDLEAAQGQMRQALASAQDAARLKSEFLATMSHEIRTPLHGVLGMADLLGETTLDNRQMRYLGNIKGSGQTLLSLLNSILDLSRLESGTVTVQWRATDIREFCKQILEAHTVAAQAKDVAMHCEVDAEVPRWVEADENLLHQVLNNLLHNAVKYTDEGRIDLRLEKIQAERDRSMLRFTIKDTGVGIEAEKLEAIFSRFEQGGTDQAPSRGGSGLGLAIAQGAVQLMGGQIQVSSKPNYGASFSFELRLREKQATAGDAASQRTSRPSRDLKGMQILVAEDNSVSAELLTEILQQFGCEVQHAADGHEAVKYANTGHFDLGLIDWMMPGLDGIEVAKAIRASDGANQKMPLIAMTAKNMPGDRESCLRAGMNDYVSKPLRMDDLRQLLEDWAERHFRTGAEKP